MLLLASLQARGKAQTTAQVANLTGTVVSPSGALVPGAEVTVYRGALLMARRITDASGVFRFQAEPGEYQVTVAGTCFASLHSSPVPFAAGGSSRFTLQPFMEGALPAKCMGGNSSRTSQMLVESPVRQEATTMPWVYGALFQGGFGVTEDRGNFTFLLAGAHLGKVLTTEIGTGALRGNFEYALELFPYWQSFTPKFQRINCPASTGSQGVNPNTCSAPYSVGGTFSGVSVTPIILRWNFTHGQRWMPWVQGAGGLVWTNHKYPAYGDTNPQDVNETGPGSDTSVWNFTPQFGIGTHYFLKPKRSLDFSANAVHISSASLGDRNPGVNASVQLSVGYSWWK